MPSSESGTVQSWPLSVFFKCSNNKNDFFAFFITMQNNHFLFMKNFKNTECAQPSFGPLAPHLRTMPWRACGLFLYKNNVIKKYYLGCLAQPIKVKFI